MIYKSTIVTLLILAIVGMSISTSFWTYNAPNIPNFKRDTQPDAFMEEVVSILMDKQGKPKLKIVTPKMIHFPEHDTTRLTAPQLTLYRKSPQPWYISSKFAKATQGIEHLNFWDDVIIHHPADETNPATLIKTTTLTVYPNQQTAETDDIITLEQPHLTIQATGMRADMNIGNIKLLSQSRGVYAPQS